MLVAKETALNRTFSIKYMMNILILMFPTMWLSSDPFCWWANWGSEQLRWLAPGTIWLQIRRPHISHYSLTLKCTIISRSPKRRPRRTRHSLSTAGEGESQEHPGLGAQPCLHLLSTENRSPLPFSPVPHQAPSPCSKKCLTQRDRTDFCPLRASGGTLKAPSTSKLSWSLSLTLPGILSFVTFTYGNSRQRTYSLEGVVSPLLPTRSALGTCTWVAHLCGGPASPRENSAEGKKWGRHCITSWPSQLLRNINK